ncbi:ATP-dependent helicase [Endozoicomonas sp. YOMI1]|uniref:ATP-dependent helicase n=1 Tax=Endozoicomonas sp. YOMI1 TaxID=2828739 RepID=UPI0021499891|nr:ATP-dependent helicase [Endozoicomonas sp. YOMI1]
MIALSEAQKSVVYAAIGNAMQVLASAGSGKTRVLTERVRYILEQTRKDCVIALTFTNKAADEMRQRLDDTEDVEDRAWVSTIHAVAQRVLEQYGHTIGLPDELHIYERDQDRMEVFLQSLRDHGVDIDEYLQVEDTKERRNRERIMQRYMDVFSTIKRELVTTEDEVSNLYPSDAERIWRIYQDYQAALLDSGGIDFDDILIRAYEVLQSQEWVGDIYRAKYKHICIDEAQDLNKAQYEFIKILCGDKLSSVLMVGDPNQMIYGFNGSSSTYLCDFFVDDFEPSRYELIENYRSSAKVIEAANKLKPGSQKENDAALQGVLEIAPQYDEFMEADWIVEKVQELLELKTHSEIEGGIDLSNMAVIARNRFVFPALEKALKEAGISFHMKKGERAAEPDSLFGKVLDLGIRIKLNPKSWVDGKKLCQILELSAPGKWDDNEVLVKLSEQALVSSVKYPELISELLHSIHQLDADDPNVRKFRLKFVGSLEALAKSGDAADPELVTSISELEEFYTSWTTFRRKGLGNSLQSYRNAKALGQLAGDVSSEGLTLSTVHTMKGLEKDIIFLAGMCEGIFPDYRAKSQRELDEEKNSAFVAVTRAKRWLYVTYPRQRTMPWGDVRHQHESRFIKLLQT